MSSLFGLLHRYSPEGQEPDSLRRFIAARRISSLILKRGEWARAAAFLTAMADTKDQYSAWYLFAAAGAYEADGGVPLARSLYERIVRSLPDLEVDGNSIHFQCLTRLSEGTAVPERRIEYLRDLIARFPDRADLGPVYYFLAEEYEKVGDWEQAVRSYSQFLPWFGASVPGRPDAHAQARRVVEFYSSPKDWTYASLPDLVQAVRQALAGGSSQKLRRLAAKVGFFAVSWHQDGDSDANSRVLPDFGDFMTTGRIQAEPELDRGSGPREAYLRTWGWTGRVPVWYLYFRKINFPADPEIHGRWEWAGIYFGEKMR